MALFGRKSVDELRLENINKLKKLHANFELVLSYAEKTEHYNKLVSLADEIAYLLPIESEELFEIDKRIINCIGDLRISLYTNRDPYRVQVKIKELVSLLNQRQTKI
jgi:hypothetical protein